MAASDIYLWKAGDDQHIRLSRMNRTYSVRDDWFGRTGQVASGNRVRDIVCVKRTVTIQWEWLPHTDEEVFDGGASFLTLLDLYEYSQQEGLLTVQLPDDGAGIQVFDCFMTDQSRAILLDRRRHPAGVNTPFGPSVSSPFPSLYWNFSVELIEA